MIDIQNLKKIYNLNRKEMQKLKTNKSKKIAVNGINLTAKENEIFGLLGPNGAGKTTTLRCIATLLKPTEGSVTVQGFDTVKQSADVRKKICFLTNELKLDPNFTPKYTVHYFGKFYGMNDKEIEQRRIQLFDKFKITDFQDKKISELSTGMKQKLSIVVSLIHDPEVIIFDEPTNGLDIITARTVTDYLKDLRNQGKIVIISTHIMSVASKLCDRMAIIINGKIVTNGTLKEILAETKTTELEDAFFELYKANTREVF